MCTLALYFRIFKDYPLIVAANRDEHYDRASAPPSRWSTKPAIVAGKDLVAGGTWLGVNEHGLLAAVLNRRIRNGQKPPPNPRSRGLLCLDVLKLKTAAEAWGVLHDFEDRYQPFTLVFADTTQAFFAYNTHREIKMGGLKQGLHGFSNTGEFEVQSEKVSRAYGQLASLADEIRSKASDASSWLQPFSKVLGDHAAGNDSNDPREAICVHGNESGTVSSSIIVYSRSNQQCQTFYCPGPPCRESFGEPVALRLR